jgi:hypothetical protein
MDKAAESDSLRSMIIQLTTHDNLIYALTMKNSIWVLTVDNGRIKPVHSDSVMRASMSHLCFANNFVLVADKSWHLTGLQASWPNCSTLDTVFDAEIPSIISKLTPGNFKVLWTDIQDDIPNGRLIGAGVGGVLYAFRLLSKRELDDICQKINHLYKDIMSDDGLGVDEEDEVEPIYPGLRWRQRPVNDRVVDGDYLMAKFGNQLWVKELVATTSLS